MPGHQKGFGVIEIIVIIAALGLIGALGWVAYGTYTNTRSMKEVSSSVMPHSAVKAETPNGFTEYENSALGLSFAYPSEWGKPVNNERFDDRLLLAATFDKKPSVSLVAAPADYSHPKPTSGDPDCLAPGFGPFSYITPTESEFSTSKELLRENKKHVVESYKNGYCAGTTLEGRVGLDLTNSHGVSLVYSSSTQPEYINDEQALPIQQYRQKYAIPDNVISKFLRVINSFNEL